MHLRLCKLSETVYRQDNKSLIRISIKGII